MEKGSSRFCATSVSKKKLSKENTRPIGENSPNLVTQLLGASNKQTTRYNLN
jgi:hypothetical protein